MPYKMIGKRRVWVEEDIEPQKAIQPVRAAQATAAAPSGLSYSDFAKDYNPLAYTSDGQRALNAVGKFAGFSGSPLSQDYLSALSDGYNQSPLHDGGPGFDPASIAPSHDPAFLQALEGYKFSPSVGRHVGYDVKAPDGRSTQINYGDTGSSFDKFAFKAIPIGLGLLAGGTFGGFIPGAEIGAAGGAGVAGGAAAAGAADIGALGLVEGVYGAGGALGAGVAPGTVGGLAGSTAGFGGLGSMLPAGVGYGAAATAAPAIFNAAADSQLASSQLGITGAQSAASATAPAAVDLGSLGGITSTAAPMPLEALRAGELAGYSTNGALPSSPAVPTGTGGLLGQLPSALQGGAQWMKDNPMLGRLLLGGASSLLSSAGGSSGESAPVNTGPAKKWTSPIQQGLLGNVQQYAPPAIAQNRPAGLLAQGHQNAGAWRFLGG